MLFYPWAQSLWMAYDLYVHPLEPREEQAGQERLDRSPPSSEGTGG